MCNKRSLRARGLLNTTLTIDVGGYVLMIGNPAKCDNSPVCTEFCSFSSFNTFCGIAMIPSYTLIKFGKM